MNLLIVGTVAYDAIETPYGKTDKILGGAATYIGLSASALGVKSSIVSVVGDDFEQKNIDLLNNKQVNTQGIEVVKGGKTFFWSGKYHENMNFRDTLVTELNVLENFSPKVPDEFKSPSVVMLGNLAPKVQELALTQLNQKPTLTVLDTMNFWMDHTWDDLIEVIKMVDVLTINEEESRQLADEQNILIAAKKILTMGPKFVLIKRGEYGAILFGENKIFSVPALPLEKVIDPTGAGDTFAGGFVGYLTKTQDFSFRNMKKAVIYATVLASFCVEQFGTEGLLKVSETQLQERIDLYKEISGF